MTGRRLYDKYVDALKASEVTRWHSGERMYVRHYPSGPVLSWPFLSQNDRNMFNDLARRITPRKRKP